jgi:hypothetical protein
MLGLDRHSLLHRRTHLLLGHILSNNGATILRILLLICPSCLLVFPPLFAGLTAHFAERPCLFLALTAALLKSAFVVGEEGLFQYLNLVLWKKLVVVITEGEFSEAGSFLHSRMHPENGTLHLNLQHVENGDAVVQAMLFIEAVQLPNPILELRSQLHQLGFILALVRDGYPCC